MSRSWLWAASFPFALLLGACGGGNDGLATSFASDDGVVSVDVPAGVAPDGFSGSVSQSDPSGLGIEISDLESVILVYELGPDGTEFSDPVTLTFRIPPELGGFDPGRGLPISLVVIEDEAGGFEPLGSMRSFLDGDVLVVVGTTTHFSSAVASVLGGQMELIVDPAGRRKNVGAKFDASVKHSDFVQGWDIGRVTYSAKGPIEIISNDADTATLQCTGEGEGTISAAVHGGDATTGGIVHALLVGLAWEHIGTLSLGIECVEPAEEVEEPPTEEPPATGSDPEGDGKNENSEPVSSDEDVPGADIKSVSHVRGSSGEHCFIIVVYGDGKETATDPEEYVGDYLISVEIRGADGWGASVRFNNGVAEPGRVFLGENASGRDTLEGAEVSVEWIDSDTMKVTVTGTELEVGEFDVVINVFSAGGSFYDHAEGVGQS